MANLNLKPTHKPVREYYHALEQYAKLGVAHEDDINNRYALMQFGWDRERRVRGNLIYVRIENSKVLIEYDGIERGITQDLVQNGIPEQDIILAFLPEAQAARIK
jgi:hypothetical protein